MSEFRHTPDRNEIDPIERPLGRFFIAEDEFRSDITPWETYEMSRDFAETHRELLRKPVNLVAKLAASKTGEFESTKGSSVNDAIDSAQDQLLLAFDQRDYSGHSYSWQIQFRQHRLTLNTRSLATRYIIHDVLPWGRPHTRHFLPDSESPAVHQLILKALVQPESQKYIEKLHTLRTNSKINEELDRLRQLQMQRTLFAHEVQKYMSLLSSGSFPQPPWRT